MKTLITMLVILFFIASSCKKQLINSGNNQTTAAAPLAYLILDKNGKDILDTLGLPKDSVTLTCTVNGEHMQFCDSIFLYNKKNDQIVAGDVLMIGLSKGLVSVNPLQTINPVHTFEISYHGNSLGNIYLDSVQYHPSWEQAIGFTFNNTPVKLINGEYVYVLQLQ